MVVKRQWICLNFSSKNRLGARWKPCCLHHPSSFLCFFFKWDLVPEPLLRASWISNLRPSPARLPPSLQMSLHFHSTFLLLAHSHLSPWMVKSIWSRVIFSPFYSLSSFCFSVWGLWGLSSLARDWTWSLGNESRESQPLDRQRIPNSLNSFIATIMTFNFILKNT